MALYKDLLLLTISVVLCIDIAVCQTHCTQFLKIKMNYHLIQVIRVNIEKMFKKKTLKLLSVFDLSTYVVLEKRINQAVWHEHAKRSRPKESSGYLIFPCFFSWNLINSSNTSLNSTENISSPCLRLVFTSKH